MTTCLFFPLTSSRLFARNQESWIQRNPPLWSKVGRCQRRIPGRGNAGAANALLVGAFESKLLPQAGLEPDMSLVLREGA
jgi:hypothetical protein